MINRAITLASEGLLENVRVVMNFLCFCQNRTGINRFICKFVVDVVDILDRSLTSTDYKILILSGLIRLILAQSLSEMVLERKFVHNFKFSNDRPY